MPNIALNIICKNESHIITRLLESVKPIVDLIVAVDTGSDDNTISLIEQFGQKYSIPTYVFERPFDNFCNSRNYAIDMLVDVANRLQWNLQLSWGLSIDCDEALVISDQFSKEQISKDLYQIIYTDGGVAHTRRSLFRLSINFRWEGPVHEIIVWEDPSVTESVLDSIYVNYERKGASWRGDLEKKYLNYAGLLTEYFAAGHSDFGTLINIIRCFMDAAYYCKSPERSREHRLTAKKYCEMAMEIKNLSSDGKIALYKQVADIRMALGDEWPSTQELFLDSYSLNMILGEPIAEIIVHHMKKRRWNTAYLFTHFAEKIYNGNDPAGKVTGVTKSYLYRWKFLLLHVICSYMSDNRTKARFFRRKLKNYSISQFKTLTANELVQIQSTTFFILFFKYWFQKLFIGSMRFNS